MVENSSRLRFCLLCNEDASKKALHYPAFSAEVNDVPIYRLIDKQFHRHYVSAGQLWKANHWTITEGLFYFELSSTDFEVDFGNDNFPFPDVWVPLEKAQKMANILDVKEHLQALLSSDLKDIYSWEDYERGDIVHNWKVRSKQALSSGTLLKRAFTRVERSNNELRDRILNFYGEKQALVIMKDRLEAGLLRWQVFAYQSFSKQSLGGTTTDEDGATTPGEAIWDVFQALICDVKTLTHHKGGKISLARERVPADAIMLGNRPLERKFLGESRPLQHVYMAMMTEKLHTELLHMAEQRCPDTIAQDLKSEPGKAEANQNRTATVSLSSETGLDHIVAPQIMVHDRMDAIEQEVYRMKRKARREMERISLQQQELQKQINTLEIWKSLTQQSRRSERIWMLLVVISIVIGVLLLNSEDFLLL